MIIHTCEQNTSEWLQARLGKPTASSFHTIMAGDTGKTRRDYMRKLAGEIITGQPMEGFSNAYTERGHAVEGEARATYEFLRNVEVEEVGFIENYGAGYSPDGLVGEDGLIEIKSKAPHLLIDILERDRMPPEHRKQVQGGLWVSEREWCDFIAYYPGMPTFMHRAFRDEKFIAEIAEAVGEFNEELSALVERIRRYGEREAAA